MAEDYQLGGYQIGESQIGMEYVLTINHNNNEGSVPGPNIDTNK